MQIPAIADRCIGNARPKIHSERMLLVTRDEVIAFGRSGHPTEPLSIRSGPLTEASAVCHRRGDLLLFGQRYRLRAAAIGGAVRSCDPAHV